MIEWTSTPDTAYGYVNGVHRYFVGGWVDAYSIRHLVADKNYPRTDKDTPIRWRHINAQVNSIAEGIQLCEMWEATGAYD